MDAAKAAAKTACNASSTHAKDGRAPDIQDTSANQTIAKTALATGLILMIIQ